MTRQTWTAVVSSLVFIALAAVLAFAPIPFVAWTPGATYDVLGTSDGQPVLKIDGITTYDTTGQLRMTTVSQTRADASLSLPEALFAYVMPHRDVLPRDVVYAPGKSAGQVANEEKSLMSTAQFDAVVAALRAAGQPVQELPMVTAVRVSGPSNNKLQPGDLILMVDNVPVSTNEDVVARIKDKGVGQKVVIQVQRQNTRVSVTIDTVGSATDGRVATIGVTVGTGYSYTPSVSFSINPDVGGGSGGLMMALAVYDRITPGDLLKGQIVAGTGTMSATGEVGAIGGIQEKIAAAEAAKAKVFFVPAANCQDTVGLTSSMSLVKVSTLKDAIDALPLALNPTSGQRPPAC
ncbi:MAG TPA: PDZ domain-containing protein [Propionibacteriaceae bacterium]|nr:PDZ domain-containing protein [Propionibacteriaceae bacterium]